MYHIEGLDLTDVVSFKKASVAFNKNRITFVRGLNMDSDPAAPTSNGAGKSLLLSCPSNLFYFTPPLALKRKSKKELLGKGSVIGLRITGNDGHKYQVEQRANKYTVLRNGEDMGLRTVPLAEKFIREQLFPIPELLYYTTCYISTQRAFPLQSSSDADRLTHLTEIFELDYYDKIKRYFLDRIGTLRESEVKLQLLERDLLEVNTKLKKLKRASNADVDVSSLKDKRRALESELATLVDSEFKNKVLVKDLTALSKLDSALAKLRKDYSSKKTPSEYSKWLKDQRKLVRAAETHEELMESYRRSVKSTKAKLDALELPDKSWSKLADQFSACENALEKLREEHSELRSARKAYDSLTEARDEKLEELKETGFDDARKRPDMDTDHSEAIAECRTTLKLKRLLEHAHDGDTKCPTCLSEIDLKNVARAVKSAEKRLPALEDARSAQRIYTELQAIVKKLKSSGFDQKRFAEVQARISGAGPAMDRIRASIKVWEQRDNYNKTLDSIKKPEAPASKPSTDLTLDQIDEALDLCESINSKLRSRAELVEASSLEDYDTKKAVESGLTKAESKLESLRSSMATRRTALQEIVGTLDQASSAMHEHGVYVSQKKKLTARIDELKPKIADKHLLEVLVKAYSSKGVKTNVANDICMLLEQNLNAYSNLIFTEPFVFSVQASNTGVSIIVDRGNSHVSDVRQMSGAESNAFRMLFILSLLPLLPDSKRVNMLTLDEPCAHMDEVFRAKFLHVFLPALSELVPNIYIITPNHDDHCEGSNQWLVKKQDGKSTVLETGAIDAHMDIGALVRKAKSAVGEKPKPKPKKRKR